MKLRKPVVYAMIAQAMQTANEVEEEPKEIKQSIEGDTTNMKKECF